MLDAIELANKLHDALFHITDKDGLTIPTSSYSLVYSKGIVAALKSAIVSNPPGTISGVTAPGAPLSAGFGAAGLVVMTPGPMLAETIKAFPPGSALQLTKENIAIVAYLSTALATFSAGSITGTCTNTSESPGPLTGGAGSGGKLSIINGPGAFAAVMAAIGPLGPAAIIHYTALVNYVLDKAEVTYSAGSVNGTCPSGGGPLIVGVGTGGTIS